VLGFGMSVTVAPLTTTVMNAVGRDASGTASGINNAVSRMAALLAIAMFGSLMAWAFDGRLGDALRAADVPPDLAAFVQSQRSKLAAVALPPGIDAGGAAAIHGAVAQAFIAGFRWIMGVSAALALASSLVAAVFVRSDATR